MDSSPAFSRFIGWSIGFVLILLAAIGFVHLGADFPNHSRWIDDAAKFTDEGWYASGALNHHLTGHWTVPGDFNPIVTIPVWPVLLAATFHFTGISVAVARGIAFAFTLCTVLAGGALVGQRHRNLAPLFMLLLLGSPILYAFSRIAILEPALLFFLTAAALAASAPAPIRLGRLLLCGILFTLAMLTKSSAAFAAPGILYLLWFNSRLSGQHSRMRLRTIAIPFATVVAMYGVYWFFAIRTHQTDVRVLYEQNVPYLGLKSIGKAIRIVYRSFTWIDPVLFPVAVLAILASFHRRLRPLWKDPLFGFAVITYVGYSGFLLLHFDAGPRYFAVLVLPVMLVVLLFLDTVAQLPGWTPKALTALVGLTIAANIVFILATMRHPDYTLSEANRAILRQMESDREVDPSITPLIIGHGAKESTFFTGIQALDDIGDTAVAQKLATYHPGWLVTYSDNLALTERPGVAGHFTFTAEGQYKVFDNPSRQYLLLYRIHPN